MSSKNKQANQNRQQFLLTFFGDSEYEEKEVNGFWLVKHRNGVTGDSQVAIMSPDAFKSYKLLNEQWTGAKSISRQPLTLTS